VVGVIGGVSPRTLANGQAPVLNPDLLSAATTLQQSGGGGYQRLVDALQSLDQAQNIVALLGGITTLTGDVTTLQGQVSTLQSQVTSINGQIGVINGQISGIQNAIVTLNGEVGTLQTQVAALQTALGGFTFGAVGGIPPGGISGSIAVTEPGGTVMSVPLYAPA